MDRQLLPFSTQTLVAVFRQGRRPHGATVTTRSFRTIALMSGGIPGVQTLSKKGDEGNLLALHPTVKPTAMVADDT